jgi:hypothetical protein
VGESTKDSAWRRRRKVTNSKHAEGSPIECVLRRSINPPAPLVAKKHTRLKTEPPPVVNISSTPTTTTSAAAIKSTV